MGKKDKNNSQKIVLGAMLGTIFLVSIYFLFSNENFYYHKNEKILFSLYDSLPCFTLNLNQSDEDLITEINDKIKAETCCKKKDFLLKINKNDKLKVSFYNRCSSCSNDLSFPFISSHVHINKDNQILFNFQLIPLDSLPIYIKRDIQNWRKQNSYPNWNNFNVLWDIKTSKIVLEKVFSHIQKGYLLYYENEAYKHYKKNLHLLKDQEIEKIKLKESNIYLGIGHKIILPVPPIK